MPSNSKITSTINEHGVEEITMESHPLVLEPLSDKPYLPQSRVVFHSAAWSPMDSRQAESRIQRNFTTAKKEHPKLLFAVLATILVGAVVFKIFFT